MTAQDVAERSPGFDCMRKELSPPGTISAGLVPPDEAGSYVFWLPTQGSASLHPGLSCWSPPSGAQCNGQSTMSQTRHTPVPALLPDPPCTTAAPSRTTSGRTAPPELRRPEHDARNPPIRLRPELALSLSKGQALRFASGRRGHPKNCQPSLLSPPLGGTVIPKIDFCPRPATFLPFGSSGLGRYSVLQCSQR